MRRDYSAWICGHVVVQSNVAQIDFVAYGVKELRFADEKRRSGTDGEVNLPVLIDVAAGESNGELLNRAELKARREVGR